MHQLSIIAGPSLALGFSAGALLTVVRPIVGATSQLLQDFTCTIVGATAGQIIGSLGTGFIGYIGTTRGSVNRAHLPFLMVLYGGVGLIVGTILGMVTSIALSILS